MPLRSCRDDNLEGQRERCRCVLRVPPAVKIPQMIISAFVEIPARERCISQLASYRRQL